MPNWCELDLTITGDKKKRDDLLAFAKTDTRCFSLDQFIPYPDKYRILDKQAAELRRKADRGEISQHEAFSFKDGFNQGGIDWCIQTWGTKWDLCESNIVTHDEKRTLIVAESAWSPPLPVIIKASQMFPDLLFQLDYYEMGAAFCGVYVAYAGKVLIEVESDYYGHRGG